MENIAVIDSVLQIINKYGWPAFLFLFILFKWFVPWIQELRKSAAEIEPDNIVEAVTIEKDIQTLLAQVANEFCCHWSVLWQFHNGSVSIGGKIPFIKMSVTNEFTESGIPTRGQQYQNLPISLFTKSLTDIADKGCIRVDRNSKEYSTIAQSYRSDGVECGYFMKISNERGIFIGLLSISFLNDVVLSKAELEHLREYAYRISIVLSRAANTYHARQGHRRWND